MLVLMHTNSKQTYVNFCVYSIRFCSGIFSLSLSVVFHVTTIYVIYSHTYANLHNRQRATVLYTFYHDNVDIYMKWTKARNAFRFFDISLTVAVYRHSTLMHFNSNRILFDLWFPTNLYLVRTCSFTFTHKFKLNDIFEMPIKIHRVIIE